MKWSDMPFRKSINVLTGRGQIGGRRKPGDSDQEKLAEVKCSFLSSLALPT